MLPALSGIIPPVVTPLRDRDALDVPGLERLIEHLLAGGVHGLFILGTTGEGPSLSYRLRRELIERVCQQTRKRVPILVGITDTAFTESVRLAQHAAECGADAVVAAPPYYWPEGQPELQQYFDHLTAELPLPLFLYNMPALTKVIIAPETVGRAMQNPKIVGIKDSSANLGYLHQILLQRGERKDWPVLIGDEETLAYAVEAGAQGGVNGGANVFPRLYVKFYEAARANDPAETNRLRELVIRMGQLYRIGNHASSGIKGIKCALSVLGICDDFMAEPFVRFQAPERARLEELLKELQPLVGEITQ